MNFCIINGWILFSSDLGITCFDHCVPVSRICVVMSFQEIDVENPHNVTNRIQFQGMTHTNLSKVYYNLNVDKDKMIQACNTKDD